MIIQFNLNNQDSEDSRHYHGFKKL